MAASRESLIVAGASAASSFLAVIVIFVTISWWDARALKRELESLLGSGKATAHR